MEMATNFALRSVGRAAVVILIAAVMAARAQKQEPAAYRHLKRPTVLRVSQ